MSVSLFCVKRVFLCEERLREFDLPHLSFSSGRPTSSRIKSAFSSLLDRVPPIRAFGDNLQLRLSLKSTANILPPNVRIIHHNDANRGSAALYGTRRIRHTFWERSQDESGSTIRLGSCPKLQVIDGGGMLFDQLLCTSLLLVVIQLRMKFFAIR
jgi:hypothetical protein